MGMPVTLQGNNNADALVTLKVTEGGLLWADIARYYTSRGYGWQAMSTAAVNSLVVRPSSTSALTLYNNSAKSYVIERVFAHNLVAAAVTTSVLWICSHPIGMTAPTDNDITIRNNTSGLSAGTEGVVDTAEGITDNGWFPWGQDSYVLTVTTPGGVLMANVNGRIIVPPTAGISVQVVSSVTSATFVHGFHWFAVPTAQLAVN